MNRDDKSKYLLYIEPKKEEKLKEPINDELTELMEMALSKAKKGASHYSDINDDGVEYKLTWNNKSIMVPSFHANTAYKGFHGTECGEVSTNYDYQLENGMITNSLATFYLSWYRNSIPDNDILKIKELSKFYAKS